MQIGIWLQYYIYNYIDDIDCVDIWTININVHTICVQSFDLKIKFTINTNTKYACVSI